MDVLIKWKDEMHLAVFYTAVTQQEGAVKPHFPLYSQNNPMIAYCRIEVGWGSGSMLACTF